MTNPAAAGDRDGYGAMLMLNLPWLSGKRADQRRAADADLAAARAARTGAEQKALAELRDAHARATSAAKIHALYVAEIVPRAQRVEEASRSAYAAGNGSFLEVLDASKSLLEAKISSDRAHAGFEQALSDLELALGEPLDASRKEVP